MTKLFKDRALLDLARFKCVHALIDGRLRIPDGPRFFRRNLGRPVTPKRPFECEESYNASGGHHEVKATVERKRDAYDLSIHFDCSISGEGPVSERQPVTEMLSRLFSLGVETTFDYDFVFEFSREAARQLFPLRLPASSDAIVDEFRGFKGVKHRNGAVAYELSIESPELKELYVNVEFGRTDALSKKSIEQRLNEASSIVREIFPKEEVGV